jgi:hypothetical protein
VSSSPNIGVSSGQLLLPSRHYAKAIGYKEEGVLVRTMAAAVVATISPFQVISSCENRVAIRIEVKVREVSTDRTSYFCKYIADALDLVSNSGHRFEAGATKAGRFDRVSRQSLENMIRDDDLVAPARALVEMLFGHAAPVVSTAERTLLFSVQTLWRYAGVSGPFVHFPRFRGRGTTWRFASLSSGFFR